MVFVRTLGAASVDAGPKRLAPSSVRRFALFFYLWAERGRAVTRSTLHELVFPDQTTKNARHSIRELLYQYRKLGVRIAGDEQTAELVPETVRADYSDLLRQERPSLEQMRAAAGGFMPGYAPTLSETYTEWLEGLRTRSTNELNRVFVAELNRARKLGDWMLAEAAAKAVLTLDPLHEEATLATAEMLAISGAKTQAVKLLDKYVEEVGSASSDLKIPATVLRRRISERSREIYRAPLTLPFLGRDAEMAALQERLGRARAGEAQCVVIVGEAGIGKTRLAEELCTQAVLAGARVERVAMQPHDVHRPMATFADIVPKLFELPGALGCSPSSIAALKRLTSDKDSEHQTLTDDASSGAIAAAISRAIADLVDAVAGETPLLIVVDDAQWADEQSQQLLSALAGVRYSRRLLILLTSRDDQLLRRFSQQSASGLGMSLNPLAESQAKELTQRALAERQIVADYELRDWIATTSGGNPFFLKCLIGHYQTTGERFVVPNTLSELLDQEIAALTRDGATTLRMCVLLGRHSLVDRLALALELPQIRLQIAINELERHHLVTLANGNLQPTHWLVAEAAERSATPIAATLMHRRVATVLEEAVDDSELASRLWDCAEHWILAGDDSRAAQVVRQCAAGANRIGRPREASELLLRAAGILSGKRRSELLSEAIELADAVSEADVVVRGFQFAKQHGVRVAFEGADLAEIVAMQFEWNDADHLRDKLLDWVSGDRPVRHRLRAGLAALVLADHRADARSAADVFRAVSAVHVPNEQRDAFLMCLLVYHSTFGDLEECRRIVDQLLLLADLSEPTKSADLRRKAGLALWRLGDAERAVLVLEAAYADAAICALRRLQFNVAIGLVGTHAALGNADGKRRWLDEVEHLALDTPTLRASPLYAAMRADVACSQQRPRDAQEWLENALSVLSKNAAGRMGRWRSVFNIRVCHLRGDIPDTDSAIECLTAHHRLGLEVGEVSDAEIALSVELLVDANRVREAHDLASRYLREFRRARHPLDPWLRSAVGRCGLAASWPFSPDGFS
jgi:DNA-binding SARP family transcriptional activator